MGERSSPSWRETVGRFLRSLKRFLTSEVKWRARALFGLLLLFALAVNGLNVLNSFVNRDFMTAIARRDGGEFARQGVLYVGVFAASTAIAVFYRFTEERLGLLWRYWLTRTLSLLYMENRTYYLLRGADGVENPDQRIADDVRAFTQTSLSFMLMSLNGLLAVISFSGVLWMISPLLFAVAVLYAVIGTVGAIWLGRPLVSLNVKQSDAEAAFRAELVHVRENAEPVALLRREGRLSTRLLWRIDALADNFRRIISVNRNLGFFTTGYNYLIQIIPALVVAPLFIRGDVEFGVITQSAVAFCQLVGAFSIVVTQIQSISAFAAVITRLSVLAGGMERTHQPAGYLAVDSDELRYEAVTVRDSSGGLLLDRLTVELPRGCRAVVTAENEASLAALVRLTAGLAPPDSGTLRRPPPDDLLILPQRPYLPAGTLREVLVRSGREASIPVEQVEKLFAELGLGNVLRHPGGIDADRLWGAELSLREQQLIAIARLILARPPFAMLDRVGTTLGEDGLRHALELLRRDRISYVALGEPAGWDGVWDRQIHINADGAATCAFPQ